MFLHFGPVHLLCNMVSLYNLGPSLETAFGPLRYLLLYLLSGLAGNLLTWLRDLRTPRPAVSAGASGAIFGLLGAYLAFALLPSTRPFVDVFSIASILALNLAYGFSAKSINMAAHLGGVIAAHTTLPVIGIPVASPPFNGLDALFSFVQMPPGIPVGVVTAGQAGGKNAALYAIEMLALNDPALASRLKAYRQTQSAKVLADDASLREL